MDRLPALFVALIASLLSLAQEGALDRSELPQGSRVVRARTFKQYVPVEAAWLDTLLAKAEDAKPIIALRDLESAVVIADSLKHRSRERDILFLLAMAQERVGKTKDAMNSLRAAHFLKDSLAAVELERISGITAQRMDELQVESQRSLAMQQEAMEAARAQHHRALEKARRSLIGAACAIVLLLAALAWSLLRIVRMRRASKVEAVPVVQDVAEPPKRNVLRPVERVPINEVPIALADPDAEMLLALFHKRMPERLGALNAARARGDHEKVARVLVSMRPQLAQQDGTRFNERCARLIAAGERVLTSSSAADLDRLIADVEQVLANTRERG